MNAILIQNARILTLGGQPGPRSGGEMNELGVIKHGNVWIKGERITRVESRDVSAEFLTAGSGLTIIDADGRVLMPSFVDCHTHACWAGERVAEWEARRQGTTYLAQLQRGGGIMATVRAVRAARQDELAAQLQARLSVILAHGTTVVEVKSGYGLTTEAELKMLRAIHDAGTRWPGRVVATACLGHALDPDVRREQFTRRVIEETLPAVSAEFPGIAVDGYCEEGAWSRKECTRLLDTAQALGHPVRVHADQFHALGMVRVAIEHEYQSVDHLEATEPDGLRQLAASDCYGVMLPCCGFQLDDRYADGRTYVDAGGKLALATNYNPGSAPCPAMPMVIALATRKLGLTIAEAITAATTNPAALLGCSAQGVIAAGQQADLVLLEYHDERYLAYEFGVNPVAAVFCRGRQVV